MNGNKALLDSNIIIYLSKGMLDAENILIKYDAIFVSIITYMEVLGYKFENPEDEYLIREFLNQFETIQIDLEIADYVISIRQHKKIKLPDAIIFASAKLNDCDLLTYNIRDFRNIDPNVAVLKPDEFPH